MTTLSKILITHFVFLTAVTVNIRLIVFWDVTPCSLVVICNLRGFVLYLEDVRNTFLRNAGRNK
jgi:hypothetical protein